MLKNSVAHFLSATFVRTDTSKAALLTGTALLLVALASSHAQAATQHVVSAGDTLSGIAVRYNVSQMALTDTNNLQVTDIQIGQVLKIPDKNKPHNLYKVQAGDSLSSLSRKFNIAIDELALVNKISPQAGLMIDSLFIIPINGQVTEKSTPSKTSTQTQAAVTVSASDKNATRHRIAYGDTLSKIARTYNVNINSLAQANNMTLSDTLYFGRYLVLPTTNSQQVSNKSSRGKSTRTTAPTVNKYVVRAGDTLMGVANKFNINFIDLAKLNNLQQYNLLAIGQVLTLPTNALMASTAQSY